MKMDTMTSDQLVDRLLDLRGAKCGFRMVAETPTRLNKTVRDAAGNRIPNPAYGTTKLSEVEVTLNPIHQNNVNAQKKREGHDPDYVAGPCQWGKRLFREDGTVVPIRIHDGKPHSMVVKFERTIQREFLRDGKPVDAASAAEIAKQLAEKNEKANDAAEEKQGVEKPVIHLTYSFENIRQVTLDGVVYEITKG
jgi:hypothetical protein